ncbi:MAG TPA: sugar kinase [Blastocatellia bacterium]|nr:sugar kinase [Blastocatellia bacterium]
MKFRTESKIVLVSRKTRLDELVARFNTVGQAKFYVEHLGADFSDYLREDEQYKQSLDTAERLLSGFGRVQVLDRKYLPNFIFGPKDTIVVLGQDGLVANTVKYSTAQPIVGVNPDPVRWEGILVPFAVDDLGQIIPELFENKRQIKDVTMAMARLNDGQVLYAVNDLFIGVNSHTSARYSIKAGDREEHQSSSGLIVSTGVGSTGWFRSLMAGALSVASEVVGENLHSEIQSGFAWDSNYLYFTVREPYPSKTSSASLVFGRIDQERPLVLISEMAESGVIFSDGIVSDFLSFNSGTQAVITPADKSGRLVV